MSFRYTEFESHKQRKYSNACHIKSDIIEIIEREFPKWCVLHQKSVGQLRWVAGLQNQMQNICDSLAIVYMVKNLNVIYST